MNPIDVICRRCWTKFNDRPKYTFLGFPKFLCPKCSNKFIYPLTSGLRATYLIFSAGLLTTVIINISKGIFILPGIPGLLMAFAVIKNFIIKGEVSNANKISLSTQAYKQQAKIEDIRESSESSKLNVSAHPNFTKDYPKKEVIQNDIFKKTIKESYKFKKKGILLKKIVLIVLGGMILSLTLIYLLKSRDFKINRIIKSSQDSVVLIETFDKVDQSLGLGTGFFLNDKGMIVTNRHILQSIYKAQVRINNETFPIIGCVAEDIPEDLIIVSLGSLIKKSWKPFSYSKIPPEVGDKIVVIGNPMGLEISVSNGIVSAIKEYPPYGEVIQITSDISPESIGSPVINMQGEVIGIASMQSFAGQNLNFAIPIEKAINLSNQITSTASARMYPPSDIRSVIARLIESIGGEEKLKSITDAIFIVDGQLYGNTFSKYIAYYKMPKLWRKDYFSDNNEDNINEYDKIDAFDGVSRWFFSPDSDRKFFESNDNEIETFNDNYGLFFYNSLLNEKEYRVGYSYLKKVNEGSRICHVIERTGAGISISGKVIGNEREFYYISTLDYLLFKKRTLFYEKDNVTIKSIYDEYYLDYRIVGGIKWPFSFGSEENGFSGVKIQKIILNRNFDKSIFQLEEEQSVTWEGRKDSFNIAVEKLLKKYK